MFGFRLLLLVIVAATIVSAFPKISRYAHPDQDQFIYIDGGIYFVGTSSVTVETASENCVLLNMTLFDLSTAKKERSLYDGLAANGYLRLQYWTSGRRNDTGVWIWDSICEPMTYINWSAGEPAPGKDYVIFDSVRYGWTGGQRNLTLSNYVCQEVV